VFADDTVVIVVFPLCAIETFPRQMPVQWVSAKSNGAVTSTSTNTTAIFIIII
jgi:hypothetical protein